jgi:hypothetical protein
LFANPSAHSPDAPALKAYMETTKTNCDVEMPNPGMTIATKGGRTIKSIATVNCKRARMVMTNFSYRVKIYFDLSKR